MANCTEAPAGPPFVVSRPSGRCLVQVCGSNRLLSELLCAHLAGISRRFCRQIREVGASPCAGRGRSGALPCLRLDLVDAADLDLSRQWAGLSGRLARASEHVMVALFNLPEDAPPGVESEALALGVRGIFYRGDSTQTLEKGIGAILAGDIWFRRELLYRAATGALGKTAERCAPEWALVLTVRERQILVCLAQGLSNQQISDQLCVSLHTVKTHLYRIYRKIGVRSRHQAALRALDLDATTRAGAPAGVLQAHS